MTSIRTMMHTAATTISIAVCATQALPQSQTDAATELELPERVLSMFRTAPEKATQHYITEMYRLVPTGRVTQDILQLRMSMDVSHARARFLSQLLAYDLDGDFIVSSDEVERLSHMNATRDVARIRTLLQVGDTDADKRLSLSEMVRAFQNDPMQQRFGRSAVWSQLMIFDLDADGAATPDEVLQVAERVKAGEVRSRANIDPDIVRDIMRDKPKPAQTCDAPKPSQAAEIVYISGYEGAFVSSVAAETQDRVTSLARLVIEPGDAPLFVVATAYESMVWDFSGAVERVERVVLSDTRGVGVRGVAKDRVSITPGSSCLGKFAYKPDSAQLARAKSGVVATFGQEIAHSYTSYTLGEVSLPSGQETLNAKDARVYSQEIFLRAGVRHIKVNGKLVPIEGPNADAAAVAEIAVERSLRRFNPGGIAEISASDVVAAKPVADYDILPQEAGLLQLVRSGHLERLTSRKFRIVRPFARFPAGLTGAHGVEFLLVPGVEMPKGDPGHSRVIDDVTGACLVGALCR